MVSYKTHIELLESAFLDLIRSVPTITDVQIPNSTARSAVANLVDVDGIAEVHGFEPSLRTPSNENWRLIVQTRASGDPRLVRESCVRLKDLINKSPNRERLYPVVAASYISKRAAEICREMNVGYFDLSGNCRLAFDSVFIERQVLENKHVEKRPLRSLFSAKSSRIARLLLENPNAAWQVQRLAEEANVSLGLASKVKHKLLEQDFVVESPLGIKPLDPERILMAWSQEYSYKDNLIYECYAPGGMNENEGKLYDYCQKRNIKCAVTLFSGSNRLAPFVRGISKSSMYIEADPREAAHELGWKEVSSGSNFQIMRPFDDFVLRNTQTSSDWMFAAVSDIQLYLDLASHKGRGAEAAEFLFEQRIKPKWNEEAGVK